MKYPKRLIEVDLPIKRISAHARREKSIRHGHISGLHIWWARRPLAACRAVILASLWPDPVNITEADVADARKQGKSITENSCPAEFINAAKREMTAWAQKNQKLCSPESFPRFVEISRNPSLLDNGSRLRSALLDFIADFSNWDNSVAREYIATSRALTKAAHQALGGAHDARPLVVDPFAGGGSIPLEALRAGVDAFASDINPVSVLLNKVVLEYIPKHGQRLADEVRKWGEWIKREAENELAKFYPKDADGATPVAYLWARTIQCEGPGCGAEVPLMRSLWLAKKSNSSIALQLRPNKKARRVDFRVIVRERGVWVDQDNRNEKVEAPKFEGTVKRGSATCPCCGYTTPVVRVREQLKGRHGGANDARMHAVVTTSPRETGRSYRLASDADVQAAERAAEALVIKKSAHRGHLSLIPDERLDLRGIRHTWGMIYGLERWCDFFTPRQSLMLATLVSLVERAQREIESESKQELAAAVAAILALGVSRLSDISNSLCNWSVSSTQVVHMFGRQAIPMTWDFAEASFLSDAAGDYATTIRNMVRILEGEANGPLEGHAEQASATNHPLPDDSASAFITDPPYYDAVPYAYLSDFFYVWLRRCLAKTHSDLFRDQYVPKDPEIVVDRTHELSNTTHDIAFYERELTRAFGEGRRVLRPDGIGTIVFASKTTASWEAILKAVVDAGWIITGSWPIDTEREARVSAQGQARLASSVHLICRPRENSDGSLRADEVGDWRDVLQELPPRIHDWMPRLAEEGVVGADAIFSCLGPALEIFSRYSRVEKASGEVVSLKDYLEHVWAAVSQEALSAIFEDVSTEGFEPDARLTAMWLWTLSAPEPSSDAGTSADSEAPDDEDEEATSSTPKKGGFSLEYDAARKIAQGLGAHLEDLNSLLEISGETARLLSVAERTQHLFGKDQAQAPTSGRKAKKKTQMDLFSELTKSGDVETTWGEKAVSKAGETTLDRIHQSMILFAAGRGEAIRRFLVDDAVGRDQRFWRLANALAALYPRGTDERRWIEGVLARKKGLGL